MNREFVFTHEAESLSRSRSRACRAKWYHCGKYCLLGMGVLARLGWEVWVDIQATIGRVMHLTKRGIDLRCSTAELVTIRKGELRDLTVAWLLHSAGLRFESTVNRLNS
jgi:hypothetical protein